MSNPVESNGAPDPAAECKKWEQQCAELLEERERLRVMLAKVQSERDAYLQAVYHFMCKDYQPPSFTKEEMLAFVNLAPPLEDFIAELEREMRSGA
jgi:hypothetical protein